MVIRLLAVAVGVLVGLFAFVVMFSLGIIVWISSQTHWN